MKIDKKTPIAKWDIYATVVHIPPIRDIYVSIGYIN